MTAREIIINLIDSKKITGEEAVILIESINKSSKDILCNTSITSNSIDPGFYIKNNVDPKYKITNFEI